MKMTRKDKMNELGLIGEKVITNMLTKEFPGIVIEHSLNKFDSEKDMLVDGKKVEVKTQTPYVKEDCFSIRENQIRKCRAVDVLYIISVPHAKYKHHSDGWVFKINPKKFTTFEYETKNGISMVGIPIKQKHVTAVYQLSDSEIKELKKYSNTDY